MLKVEGGCDKMGVWGVIVMRDALKGAFGKPNSSSLIVHG